jgi:hypothetical protein
MSFTGEKSIIWISAPPLLGHELLAYRPRVLPRPVIGQAAASLAFT